MIRYCSHSQDSHYSHHSNSNSPNSSTGSSAWDNERRYASSFSIWVWFHASLMMMFRRIVGGLWSVGCSFLVFRWFWWLYALCSLSGGLLFWLFELWKLFGRISGCKQWFHLLILSDFSIAFYFSFIVYRLNLSHHLLIIELIAAIQWLA